MNTEIISITKAETGLYLDTLKDLIRCTIDLPQNALTYFSEQWTEERLQDNLDKWIFLLAKENNGSQGVLLGTPIEGGVGTVIWVLVNKDQQGKGIGGQLFTKACALYKNKGAHKIKLTVPDEKTVDFYKKQGMVLEGTHKNHWWGADFWAMGKTL